jgi:hypothetical protein
MTHPTSLEQRLQLIRTKAAHHPLTLREILTVLNGKGRPLLLVLLSLPFCQPIMIPGLSIPFGLIIAGFGLRTVFGGKGWGPKRLLKHQFKKTTVRKLTKGALWLLKKVRPILKPRLVWLSRRRPFQVINGLLICLLGLMLALPLPVPFINMLPSWSILLISLGLLEEDGLFILAGYLLTLGAAVVLMALVVSADLLINLF